MNQEEAIKAVHWGYRICNYLFRLGVIWILVGAIVRSLAAYFDWWWWPRDTMELVGSGIFTAAFALTLAIYRCPVCDQYLSRFRPRKDQCGHCGARVS